MDYLVAQDLIRSEHLDLVREGGLNGFKHIPNVTVKQALFMRVGITHSVPLL